MIAPFFLNTPEGALHLSLYIPPEGAPSVGWVVHVPAFAEEMNKSRAMVSLQARALAASGHVVAVPDLYGTGDSAGELREATWELWQRNIEAVLAWAGKNGGSEVCLWGLRAGCLLALQVARANHDQVTRLVLWQPVVSGQQFLTQFLRLRMAAGLSAGGGETTGVLRDRLARDEVLEVAGYELTAKLAGQLDPLAAQELPPPPRMSVLWLEVVGRADKPLSPASRRVLDSWRAVGASVRAHTAVGDAFWATQEIALAPALLDRVGAFLSSARQLPDGCLLPDVSHTAPGDRATELPVVFHCQGEELVGILHRGSPSADTGVLLIVGGPQYRVGSHRQFVHLGRDLAAQDIPVLRFDCRGMGDSSGNSVGFLGIHRDIASAIDELQRHCPALTKVVIWGLCDAATAASFYAPTDERVEGLVLLNPWVHSEQGQARAYLKHYYARRLFDPSLWRKILTGKFHLAASLGSLKGHTLKLLANPEKQIATTPPETASLATQRDPRSLGTRLFESLARFRYPVLLILSGRDLTAAEFGDTLSANRRFGKLLQEPRFMVKKLELADHTFSRREWRDQVAQWTVQWLRQL